MKQSKPRNKLPMKRNSIFEDVATITINEMESTKNALTDKELRMPKPRIANIK
jgi:hypothetical protein